jgi:hypothetical protein
MTRARTALFGLFSIGLSITLFAVCAEIILRFLPVATGMRSLPVTVSDPVFRFTPGRAFVFSKDWDFRIVNYGRVNNDGWVNDQDYQQKSDVPLLAVVGDSYIEAAMVPNRETMEGRLAQAYRGRVRVYSFAASGAPLSQYLIWAQYAVKKYGAEALIINVVGNDFDQSLAAYTVDPGFWHYVSDRDGTLRLQLFEHHVAFATWLVRHSALLRYLAINLQIAYAPDALSDLALRLFHDTKRPRYAGNTSTDAGAKRVSDSLAAIDAFFRDLPAMTGLPPDRIAFTLDSVRYPPSGVPQPESYFEIVRRSFRQKGEALGYEVIDLEPLFFAHYRKHHQRFEFPDDGHWNSLGHSLAAEAVQSSRLMERLLSVQPAKP